MRGCKFLMRPHQSFVSGFRRRLGSLCGSGFFGEARGNGFFGSGFGADEDFLQAFGRLDDRLESSRDLSLHADGTGSHTGTQGLASVRAADDDRDNTIHRLDTAQDLLAFLRGAPVASARWHAGWCHPAAPDAMTCPAEIFPIASSDPDITLAALKPTPR